MSRLLQKIGFKENRYDRPNQEWTCGNAGIPCQECPNGPTKRGKCVATTQCLPILKNDRYQCNRTQSLGGQCEQGPFPDGSCCHTIKQCVPERNLRGLRKRWCYISVAVTMIFILFVIFHEADNEIINPGALTSAHAVSTSSCQDCHAFESDGMLDAASFIDIHGRSIADSELCLDCHDMGTTSNAFSPHTQQASTLNRLTENAKASSGAIVTELASALYGNTMSHTGEIACSSCHNEHKGAAFDLTAMTNQQCQVCHTARFDSFAEGHPEFDNYPHDRRTRIIFDHNSHLKTHFVDSKFADMAPNSCQSCHQTTEDGSLMIVKSFEQSCASCHGDQIRGDGRAGDLGIAVFRLPALDTVTLDASGRSVGGWQEFAEGDLTPFMHLLLLKKAGFADVLAQLDGVDLYDLSQADDATLEAAEAYGWAVKELFFDLIMKGQEMIAVEERPELVALISQDFLVAAQEQWLPDLMEEVPQYRAGRWDANQHASIETTTDFVDTSISETALGGDDNLLSDNGDSDVLLLEDDSGGDLLLADDGDGGDEGGLLMADDRSDGDLLMADDSDEGDLLFADDNSSGGLLIDDSDDGASLFANDDTDDTTEIEAVSLPDQDKWSLFGGWYRNDNNYTLFYRPTGHSDVFLTSWINVTAEQYKQAATAKELFHELTEAKAPGLCVKCHSIDVVASTPTVNWLGAHPKPTMHNFTEFNHSAHFSLMTEQGCVVCHELNQEADYASSFEANNDPHKYISNFNMLSKGSCTSCHTASQAGDSCVKCHNYHVGERMLVLPGEQFIQAGSVSIER